MTRFGDLVAIKGTGTPIDRLEPMSPESIAAIRSACPDVPADYLDFLEQVGAGPLGEQDGYMLYGSFMDPDEIYNPVDPEIEGLLIVGDDLQGFNNGYDPQSWELVEIDSTDMATRVVAPNFETFIRTRIAELS